MKKSTMQFKNCKKMTPQNHCSKSIFSMQHREVMENTDTNVVRVVEDMELEAEDVITITEIIISTIITVTEPVITIIGVVEVISNPTIEIRDLVSKFITPIRTRETSRSPNSNNNNKLGEYSRTNKYSNRINQFS